MKGTAELTHGKNLVDAAKEAGVKFFIWRYALATWLWSSFKLFNPDIQAPCPTSRKNLVDCIRMSSTTIVRLRGSLLLSADVLPIDKAEILEYLKASGTPYAVLLTSWFAENLSKYVSDEFRVGQMLILDHSSSALKKTDTGYTIPIPKFGPDDVQIATWVKHDFGAAALALLLNYADTSKNVIGGSFPVISMKFTYSQLAAAIAKGAQLESSTDQRPTLYRDQEGGDILSSRDCWNGRAR
jgi:hypothetical protein